MFAASASVLALEPHVGVVYARLIVAGVFALVVLAIMLALVARQRGHRPPRRSRCRCSAQDNGQRTAQFAQIAMIVEAVMLGYSLARRR